MRRNLGQPQLSLLLLLLVGVLSCSIFQVNGVVGYVYADGDGGGDGGDGGDGDDGGDDGSDDGGDDGGDDGDEGGGDAGDEGSEFEDEDFLEWLSEGGGVEVYQQDEEVEWISGADEHRLIASQWGGISFKRTPVAVAPVVVRPDIRAGKGVGQEKLFPSDQLMIRYPRIVEDGENDIAVIIGNANYQQFGSSVPDVVPAYADAEAFARFVREGLGVREGNIIHLRDATQAQMIRLFGRSGNPQGQLYDWVRKRHSRIYLYFSGHGAPGGEEGNYLVPADADGARLALNGYSVDQLYQNLSGLQARSVTVVLEACFSGVSQDSALVTHASPIFVRRRPTTVPDGVTVISAGDSNQIASWEQDRSHGLFTKYYLHAMSGEADQSPHGNGDGQVDLNELERYLQETLSYWARRYYGREQVAQIHRGEES